MGDYGHNPKLSRSHHYHEPPDRATFGLRSKFQQLTEARRAKRSPASSSVPDLQGVGNLLWRPLRADDHSRLMQLVSDVEDVENPPFRTTSGELSELFAPGYTTNSVGGFHGNDLLAYGFVRIPDFDAPFEVATLSGTIHPNARDAEIATKLLSWQVAAARSLVSERARGVPAYVQIHVDESESGSHELLSGHGFVAQGVVTQMRRQLDDDLPKIEVPSHVRIEPWTEELHDAVKQVHDLAFEQAGEDMAVSQKEWTRARERFVPEWSYVAVDRSTDRARIAGYVLAAKWEEDWTALGWSEGYIEAIGVLEEWRSQGVAKSLLVKSMKAMRRDGMEYAGLDADNQNPTGAQQVFATLGFEPTHTTTQYVVEL